MKNLENALWEYIDSIHSGITYVENALSLIKDNEILVVDVSKYEKLQEIMGFVEIKMNGGTISDETIQAAINGNNRMQEQKAGGLCLCAQRHVQGPRQRP